jgi:hypothetical protein
MLEIYACMYGWRTCHKQAVLPLHMWHSVTCTQWSVAGVRVVTMLCYYVMQKCCWVTHIEQRLETNLRLCATEVGIIPSGLHWPKTGSALSMVPAALCLGAACADWGTYRIAHTTVFEVVWYSTRHSVVSGKVLGSRTASCNLACMCPLLGLS